MSDTCSGIILLAVGCPLCVWSKLTSSQSDMFCYPCQDVVVRKGISAYRRCTGTARMRTAHYRMRSVIYMFLMESRKHWIGEKRLNSL